MTQSNAFTASLSVPERDFDALGIASHTGRVRAESL